MKPSERIEQIQLKLAKDVSQESGVEFETVFDFAPLRFQAIIQYLDEQEEKDDKDE